MEAWALLTHTPSCSHKAAAVSWLQLRVQEEFRLLALTSHQNYNAVTLIFMEVILLLRVVCQHLFVCPPTETLAKLRLGNRNKSPPC